MTLAVKVKCFNGQSYNVELDPHKETVADFQRKISAASGITPERQTLLFKGKVLDHSKPVSEYEFANGALISVVRRVGKSKPEPAPAPAPAPAAEPAPSAKVEQPTASKSNTSAPPSLDEMMRGLGLGAGAGNPEMPGLENFTAMLNGLGGGGGGAGAGAGAGLYSQLPSLLNGMFAPMLQDYLSDPEKQELSRESILNNPILKQLCDSDPEFSKVVNDPVKWKESMAAAKQIFAAQQGGAGAAPAVPAGQSAPAPAPAPPAGSAAATAPPGMNVSKLSESYGHALGQSLVNSGLGLDPELVVKGLRLAVAGRPFPMPLPEYERSMATLQQLAQEYLTKTNLEHANNMFAELEKDGNAVILEPKRIAYELGEIPDKTKRVVKEGANVLVIVTARLLDGRHFFTCPAADDSGESVHPLTLALDKAPKALAKGILGMHEGETRLLYVHPDACDGMPEMFGDLLPPNALLIFDLQLLDADAPPEDDDELDANA